MLAAVSEHPQHVLQEALHSLIDTELVYLRSRPPNAIYSFKHALVRDAAYGLLLRDRRRELHARIAEVLETRFPDTAERQPELLAQHHEAAGSLRPALMAWIAAAKRASDRWAMAEAAADYENALAILVQQPETDARRRQELQIITALGGALVASRGYTAQRTGEVYDRAAALCGAMGDTANLIRVGNGQWLHGSSMYGPTTPLPPSSPPSWSPPTSPRVLPPIPPGLPREEFMRELEERIESESQAMLPPEKRRKAAPAEAA
jgi:predicted ATPase